MKLEWLRNQMLMHGLSQRELAHAIGITDQMFTNVVAGRRSFKAVEVDAIRRYFGFTLPEDEPSSVAVAGRISAGAGIDLVDGYERGEGLYKVVRPAWIPTTGVVGAEIVGASAEPWALDGDIVFWSRTALGVLSEDLGRPVVAETTGGEVFLKRLAAGSRPGLWSLISINPTFPSMFDVRLRWAARALPPLARDLIVTT